LISSYISLKKKLSNEEALLALLTCESSDEIMPSVENLLRYRADTERVLTLLMQRYKKAGTSIKDIE
jgi:hypothetical protein